MFTGLIETTGRLVERSSSGEAGRLAIKPDRPFTALKRGESVAVNGACLTLERLDGKGNLHFHALAETFKRTNLGDLSEGDLVNLERALALGDRLGGHLVTGHVDAAAPVAAKRRKGDDWVLEVRMPEALAPFFVEKGSVAIDGVSLTLVNVGIEVFSVHLIPVTLEATNLSERGQGDLVNVETDLIGKYVRRQIALDDSKGRAIDMALLREAGW